MLNDELSNLLESSVRSVWDSYEKVLGSGSIGLLIIDSVDTVDEDAAQVLLLVLVLSFQ